MFSWSEQLSGLEGLVTVLTDSDLRSPPTRTKYFYSPIVEPE